MASELFELSLLGGAYERRYRRLRPDVDRLPWDSLDASSLAPEILAHGRRFWTLAAFQEHRTGAACAATLEALIAARAPVDLIAVASGFVLDEMAHVELCARVAAVLGGGAPLQHDPGALFLRPSSSLSPLLRAAELVVRVFCVGEAFSVPMQRATAAAAKHRLIKAVIKRIARDEAAHGQFGWIFLDWAEGFLDEAARAHLTRVAAAAIEGLVRTWDDLAPPREPSQAISLGWLPRDQYLTTARRVLDEEVRAPLRARRLLQLV